MKIPDNVTPEYIELCCSDSCSVQALYGWHGSSIRDTCQQPADRTGTPFTKDNFPNYDCDPSFPLNGEKM